MWDDNTSGNAEILYRRSTDGGANFEPTVNLSNNAVPSSLPDIAASGNNVYVVWDDGMAGSSEVLYRRSIDGGAVFDPAVNLSNTAGDSSSQAVAASENNVYVVWDDNTTGNNEILYRRSTDGGAGFSATVNLSNNAGSSNIPDIAAFANLPV
jgi:hypothetical protein